MNNDTNNPLLGFAVIGVVTGVFRDTGGDDYIPILNSGTAAEPRYLHDYGDEVVYDVKVNLPEGVFDFLKLRPMFPRPFSSFATVCHPVGFPVQGVRLNDVLYLDFHEAPQEVICP